MILHLSAARGIGDANLQVCFYSYVNVLAPLDRCTWKVGVTRDLVCMGGVYARSGNVAVELPLLSTDPFSLDPV